MEGFDDAVKATLCAQATQDPQLPRANPTTSFWQMPPHAISDVQSPALPATTDYAVIGSGVTGCSVAKHLLDLGDKSVTVFEARTLTSGATGRNGGLLTSFVPGDYKLLVGLLGREQAIKVARFANRTLDKMHELGNSTPEYKTASEVRRLRDVVCFRDDEGYAEAKESWDMYEVDVPEDKGTAEFFTANEAEEKFNVRAPSGAIVYPNGAFWPYRLVTAVWATLLQSKRLSVETNTPVTAVAYDPSDAQRPYVLTTARGSVRAAKVIHATNGYTGHLLPALRGKIYPLRGTMSTQKGTPEFGQHGSELAWSVVGGANFDKDMQALEVGLYYANQNPRSGDLFIGGEKAKLDEVLISDDTTVGAPCAANLETILPKVFVKGWTAKPEVRRIWSGIMGFTADRMPLVGALPKSITSRGEGEYVAAGFNGYGMPLCWSCGEAVAKMAMGIEVDFLPEVLLATEKRLEQGMDTIKGLELLFGGHP